jgi:hypothetical protein
MHALDGHVDGMFDPFELEDAHVRSFRCVACLPVAQALRSCACLPDGCATL